MYVSFEVESMDVNETDGIISIFLELSNVTGSTKDPILIDVSSQDGTTGMVASKSAHTLGRACGIDLFHLKKNIGCSHNYLKCLQTTSGCPKNVT